MNELLLQCRCGAVKGKIKNIQKGSGNRIVCYCEDCQRFAKQCSHSDDILDEFGGTEILQINLSAIEIDKGIENIACLKLKEKGMIRWYTTCCKTPVANTVGMNLPFAGVIHSFFDREQELDRAIGPIIAAMSIKSAIVPVSDNIFKMKAGPITMIKMIVKLLSWKFSGKRYPNPFFTDTGEPVSEPRIL